MTKRQPVGFTLIEVLVVLTLIVAVVGFGGVRMMQMQQGNQWEHALQDLTTALRYLQLKAIEDGRIYELTINETGRGLSVGKADPSGRHFESVQSGLLRSVRLGQSLGLILERPNGLLFFPDGSTSKNRLILSKTSGERSAIEIKNRIGTVQVSRA